MEAGLEIVEDGTERSLDGFFEIDKYPTGVITSIWLSSRCSRKHRLKNKIPLNFNRQPIEVDTT
jgi:hypothetical protein